MRATSPKAQRWPLSVVNTTSASCRSKVDSCGHNGDAVIALLAAAGHNQRLILAKLALWDAFITALLPIPMANTDPYADLPTAGKSMT
ncbi:protein of unknown function (plasmid) [Agrobacterium pusense]|uniref:Uncharacterized protein n=1 Tax=Agrobacterium pusense TaxID=648995 RepID=U4Q4A7_9HYPH|nr:protein of unknown function [Agrobacterium pusense]